MLKAGDFSGAEKKLKSWLKKNSPRPFERIRISEYYTWMGLDSAATKILGPPLASSDLKTVDPAELCIQLRLSYMLGMMGAKYVALGLMRNIEERLKTDGEVISNHYPQYFQNYAYLHLSYYMSQRARWGFESALKLYSQDSYQFFYISLGLCDCDAIDGNFEMATKRVMALSQDDSFSSNKLLKATALQALGEYLNYSHDFKAAREAFEQSFESFGVENHSKDFSYLLKHSGLNRIWSKSNPALGIDELIKAKDLLARPDQTPTSLIEVLFWINLYDPSKLSIEERLTLLAYPNYSVYSLAAGRVRDERDETSIPPWVKREIQLLEGEDKSSEVWLADQKEIKVCDYEELEVGSINHEVIDLKSSIIFSEEKSVESLSELQAKILIALAGGGSRGVHQYLLTDSIYRQEFINWESGLDRIKKAVKALEKFGLDIKVKNLNYIWHREDQVLILPTDLRPKRWYPYARKILKKPFNSDELAEVLGMSTRNAQRLIKEWRQEDILDLHASHSYLWRGGIP